MSPWFPPGPADNCTGCTTGETESDWTATITLVADTSAVLCGARCFVT